MPKASFAVLIILLGASMVVCSCSTGVPTPVVVVPTLHGPTDPPAAIIPAPADTPKATPTPVVTPTTQPVSEETMDVSAWEWKCLWLTNQLRADHGLPPLKAEAILVGTARAHSKDMATRDYVDHTTPDGIKLLERLQAAGYNPTGYFGENIRVGQRDTPETAIEWWYDEQPPDDWHRRNLLSVNFREFGCGIEIADDSEHKRYFTQNFGQRDNVYPVIINGEAISTTRQIVELYLYGQSWGATEMMLSESDDFEGATWQPFTPTAEWTLSSSSGWKTVYAKIRNAAGETQGPVWDTIRFMAKD